MTTITRSEVKLMNVTLSYLTAGEGRLIIFLHSFCGWADLWNLCLQELGQYYKVCAIDLPGFGQSELPKGSNFTEDYYVNVANIIKNFIEIQGYQKASIVGNSMGGGIALQFAFQFPGMVDKLALVDSSNLGKEVPFIWRLLGLPSAVMGIIFRLNNNKFWIRYLWNKMFYNKKFVSDKFIGQSIIWGRKPGTHSLMLGVAKSKYGINLHGQKGLYLNKLHQINVPTLIVWGSEDKMLPPSHGEVAHSLIPKSQLVVFPECGHLLQIEKANEFNKLLLSFLGIFT
jgi:pimeloyl-ACP methyl ester carboxylesterase